MCGEKFSAASNRDWLLGSPPHVRGKASMFCYSFHEVRITPACAGKSRQERKGYPEPQDHPRMCGEKDHMLRLQPAGMGSPPHVRGKD